MPLAVLAGYNLAGIARPIILALVPLWQSKYSTQLPHRRIQKCALPLLSFDRISKTPDTSAHPRRLQSTMASLYSDSNTVCAHYDAHPSSMAFKLSIPIRTRAFLLECPRRSTSRACHHEQETMPEFHQATVCVGGDEIDLPPSYFASMKSWEMRCISNCVPNNRHRIIHELQKGSNR